MKLGIIGNGVVGNAMARCFMEHAEIRCWDIRKERSTHPLREVLESDLVFVCLPTPSMSDGSCNLDPINSFFQMVEMLGYAPKTKFVLRSTVPIGTTARIAARGFQIVHSPEFLTARCAVVDAQTPSRMIIGNPTPSKTPGHPLWSAGNKAAELTNILYHTRFPGVRIHLMTSDESEAVKLMLNSFFAVKVSFFNEIRALADALKLDWERVIDGILSDGRIAHSHTKVPGPDGQFGYAGACLPKDIADLEHCFREAGLSAPMLTASIYRNRLDRTR